MCCEVLKEMINMSSDVCIICFNEIRVPNGAIWTFSLKRHAFKLKPQGDSKYAFFIVCCSKGEKVAEFLKVFIANFVVA